MKVKTHSGAKKRIRKTGTGKLQTEKAARRHLLLQKSRRQKAKGKSPIELSSAMTRKVKKMIPHS